MAEITEHKQPLLSVIEREAFGRLECIVNAYDTMQARIAHLEEGLERVCHLADIFKDSETRQIFRGTAESALGYKVERKEE